MKPFAPVSKKSTLARSFGQVAVRTNGDVSGADGMDALVVEKAKVLKRRNSIRQGRHFDRDLQLSGRVDVGAVLRRERTVFAAKIRSARAILGWSQRDLGLRVSMTQKSIYRMEQGTHELRRSTVLIVEQVLKAEGIEFEDIPGGGFNVLVPERTLSKLDGSTTS
jgi:DNA-binding XRE family transcriptional regulator